MSSQRTDRQPQRRTDCRGRNVGRRLAVVLALCGPVLGCNQPKPAASAGEAAPPWFIDVTRESGLDFVHDGGPTGHYFLPQIIGSGAALFDYDNDGLLDILLVQNGGPRSASTHRLYHQVRPGKFKDVTAGSGLDVSGYGMGVAVGDVNNDGLPDVVITEYGRVRLFLNRGGGHFTDVTRESGIDSPLWGTSASFVDYDRDGWLDLVIVNYVEYDPSRQCLNQRERGDYCHPNSFSGSVAKLFHNRGRAAGAEAVRFEDVTLASGLGRLPGPGLGVVCADFDGDGWPDIFVANDAQPNRLWINRHDGTFTEEAVSRGLAFDRVGQALGNMGVALADVDGDGFFDLFVTHLTDETHTLWRQGPRGTYQDRTAAAGLTNPRWRGTGFGTVLADFDHDGAVDLALVNGRVSRLKFGAPEPGVTAALGPYWSWYAERNQVFANDGTGRFRDLSPDNPPFCGAAAVSRGLACGDVDGDGALDLLVTSVAGPARLYRNVAPKRGHWLMVRALDPALRRDAYGAEIVVVDADGRRRLGWINPGSSYLCSNDPRAHFGLGPCDRVDAIHVLWPDGKQESFPGRAADQLVVLRKGEGIPKTQ
jgi:hypothetical protein